MKTFIDYRMYRGFLFMFIMFVACAVLSAQEGESKAIEFKLNNMPDTDPPSIKMLSPAFDGNGVFRTEEKEVELMGEITDASKIRFVSVNMEIRMVNETGIFAETLSLVPGENQILIKTMDEHNYMRELVFTIESNPPILTLEDKILKKSRYYGLVIGIDNYRDPSIPDLDNPVKDAKSIVESLTNHYTFEKENVILLKNPGRNEIIEELDGLRGKITPEDNLLIFYAGHGWWDSDANNGYWLPADSHRDEKTNWFRNSTLVDYLKEIHSKHTLLITDACFGGSIFQARSAFGSREKAYEKLLEIYRHHLVKVEEAGEDQTGRLYRKTEVLGLIGAIAPMLGLTGTVLGMIEAFNKIAATGTPNKITKTILIAIDIIISIG